MSACCPPKLGHCSIEAASAGPGSSAAAHCSSIVATVSCPHRGVAGSGEASSGDGEHEVEVLDEGETEDSGSGSGPMMGCTKGPQKTNQIA